MILKETVTKVTQVVMIRELLKNIADRAVYEHDIDTKNKDTKKAEGEEDEVQVTKTARKRKRDDKIGQTRSTPGGETSTRSQGSPRKEEKRPKKIKKEWSKIWEGGGTPINKTEAKKEEQK